MRQKRIYIAGPMTNKPFFNFPRFLTKAKELQEQGWVTFCPAQEDIDRAGWDFSVMCPNGTHEELNAVASGINYRTCMEADLSWICREADAIYMMHGWEKSSGAKIEWALACLLGLEIIYE